MPWVLIPAAFEPSNTSLDALRGENGNPGERPAWMLARQQPTRTNALRQQSKWYAVARVRCVPGDHYVGPGSILARSAAPACERHPRTILRTFECVRPTAGPSSRIITHAVLVGSLSAARLFSVNVPVVIAGQPVYTQRVVPAAAE